MAYLLLRPGGDPGRTDRKISTMDTQEGEGDIKSNCPGSALSSGIYSDFI